MCSGVQRLPGCDVCRRGGLELSRIARVRQQIQDVSSFGKRLIKTFLHASSIKLAPKAASNSNTDPQRNIRSSYLPIQPEHASRLCMLSIGGHKIYRTKAFRNCGRPYQKQLRPPAMPYRRSCTPCYPMYVLTEHAFLFLVEAEEAP